MNESTYSMQELVQQLLGGPNADAIAQQIYDRYRTPTQLLREGCIGLEQAIRGLGPQRAARIRAALELGRRAAIAPPNRRVFVKRPNEAYTHVLAAMASLSQEEMWVLNLNTRNQLLHVTKLYRGTVNSSAVRVSEIFADAIRLNAAAIIIGHNHPSGDPSPSPEDIHTTRQIVAAGKALDLELLDHLIIGDQARGYVSLRERGAGFD